MKITQMKFQKIVVKTAFLFAAFSAFYALMFASQLYEFTRLYGLYNGAFPGENGAVMSEAVALGRQLYYDIQPFNHTLFNLSLTYLIVSISLLVFFNQKRRIYYLSNYITTGVVSAFGIIFSIFALVNIFGYMSDYSYIVEYCYLPEMKEYLQTFDDAPSISAFPWSFILGIVVFVGNIILSCGMIGNAVWKYLAVKKEKQQYAQIDAEIYAKWDALENELNKEAETYES